MSPILSPSRLLSSWKRILIADDIQFVRRGIAEDDGNVIPGVRQLVLQIESVSVAQSDIKGQATGRIRTLRFQESERCIKNVYLKMYRRDQPREGMTSRGVAINHIYKRRMCSRHIECGQASLPLAAPLDISAQRHILNLSVRPSQPSPFRDAKERKGWTVSQAEAK